MKKKIVIWGTNEAEEKLLIALELQADAGKVMLYTFSEAIATEEFVTKMMGDWRDNKEVEFPEGHVAVERKLSVTDGLIPDEIKVDRGDLIQRAQTEWHFAVLSSKLHKAYEQELAEFKEKVEQLDTYDSKIWDGLKSFWDKVQNQSRERNLFREHANHLRDNINLLFEDLKKMRAKVQGEFMAASAGVAAEFNTALDNIDERIAAGGTRLNSVFEELKQMQRRYREARMSNEHRNQIWNRIDKAFKKAKERKFGPSANEGSLAERHERRLAGLKEAVKRMSDSIRRDEEELTFQNKKISNSEGQLESQIRMAKIKMIDERVVSKREKLEEMQRTMVDIERQANVAKNKEAKRLEKEEERKKIAAAKEAVKSEIAAEIKTKAALSPEEAEGNQDAADETIGDVLTDALDSAKTTASKIADKAEDSIEKAAEKGGDFLDTAKAIASVVAEKAQEVFDEAMDKAEEALDEHSKSKKAAASEAGQAEAASSGDSGNKEEAGMESTAKAEQADGIIIEDIVHKEAASAAKQADGIIIEDIVHKEAASAAKQADGIIIEDIVHKEAEGLESTAAPKKTAKKKPAKPKAPAKKKDKPSK